MTEHIVLDDERWRTVLPPAAPTATPGIVPATLALGVAPAEDGHEALRDAASDGDDDDESAAGDAGGGLVAAAAASVGTRVASSSLPASSVSPAAIKDEGDPEPEGDSHIGTKSGFKIRIPVDPEWPRQRFGAHACD